MAYALTIVHLSDLHFGKNSRFKDKEPGELGHRCARSIQAALEKRFHSKQVNLILVTGDLTQQADEEEFGQIQKFFVSLQAAFELERSRFVFMPGNHDVSWEACRAYFSANPDKRSTEYDGDLEVSKLDRFNRFREQFYAGVAPITQLLERDAVLHSYPNLGICIAALNSCEQETDKKDEGVVSKAQAQAVMDRFLLNPDYAGYIRILALHHTVNSDPNRVERWRTDLKKKCEGGLYHPQLPGPILVGCLLYQGK